MNKKIVVTRLLLAGHLIVCFNRSLVAGNLLAPDSLGSVGALSLFQTQTLSPASGLQLFLKQASAVDKPLALTLKQTDDDSFDDENKTKAFDKHDEPDDFDKLSMPFEHDSEDESELPPDNKREDSAKDHVILEWNDTEQKITRRQVPVETHELTEEKHLHVNIDLTAELAELKEELKAPEINATSIALPRASSPESVYPVTQNEEGESSEGEDSSSEDGGSDDNESEEIGDDRHSTDSDGSNDSEESVNSPPEGSILPEGLIQAAMDRGRADDGLTYIQLEDIKDGQYHYHIRNEDILDHCSLTEAGATELQAENTQLFATPEAAITAFTALKQGGIRNKMHALEYQMLARLILKYEDGQEKTIDNFFSSERENTRDLCTYILDHTFMPERICISQVKPLQLTDDDHSLLVVCHARSSARVELTEAGSEELHSLYPDLFKTKNAARYFYRAIDLNNIYPTSSVMSSVNYIDTHHYQAIAKLIQDYKQTGNIKFVLTDRHGHYWTYVDTIPYGMLRHGFFSFEGERYVENKVSYEGRIKYKTFLKQRECFLAIKELVDDQNLSPKKIVSILRLLFADKDITLESLMRDTKYLLGSAYKQAKASFESHYSQMNKPAEDDRPNASEDEHKQPGQED